MAMLGHMEEKGEEKASRKGKDDACWKQGQGIGSHQATNLKLHQASFPFPLLAPARSPPLTKNCVALR